MNRVEGHIVAVTDSVGATRAVAEVVARLARAGDLILLTGDLGAGKTAFAQGFARGLGVEGRVTSPTFALVQTYEGRGRLRMHHLDVYRLGHSSEVADLGLSELLDDEAVTIIEWGDMIRAALPNDFLEVSLTALDPPSVGTGDDASSSDTEAGSCHRRLGLSVRGPAWRARLAALESALGPWSLESGGR